MPYKSIWHILYIYHYCSMNDIENVVNNTVGASQVMSKAMVSVDACFDE